MVGVDPRRQVPELKALLKINILAINTVIQVVKQLKKFTLNTFF